MNDWAIVFLIIGVGCLLLAVGCYFGDRLDDIERERRDARRRNRGR